MRSFSQMYEYIQYTHTFFCSSYTIKLKRAEELEYSKMKKEKMAEADAYINVCF